MKARKKDGFLNVCPATAFHPNNYEIYKMIGNIWEWTQSKFVTQDSQSNQFVLKGGSFIDSIDGLINHKVTATTRMGNTADAGSNNVGFRCCKGLGGGRKAPPDQKKIETMEKTNEALQAGIDKVKPGNTADDVAQAFWKVLEKYGIEKTSRTGYSIGIGYPPDWGEHTLNIYKGDKTLLEPNVCFHMIAVMQFGDWGVEASESIRVTDKGSELFCNYSRNLHIK